ncbi:hypothetical protein SNE25_08605 [Mucilaginibacter sabulilitoris]|uniref:Uncharacterized protein n=1 Tax=Mucilaginibacter sabulilitoris TaxID=1173583 RepID=A0ABZ0TR38_9SPHI|nr:hypothetical protein [Mucilaginibacter sabulilitoris]WPU95582.1 hypothetical protein SNE25_08605 [Mucilaginibacter sabulilitoris]
MKDIAISNRRELRSEIQRLSLLDHEHLAALGNRFSSPAAIFSAAVTLFPRSAAARSMRDQGLFGQDFFSLISRFLIPITLNKTLFRRSGFMVKLLVGLLSQKVAGYITDDAVERVIKQGGLLIGKLFAKKEQEPGDRYEN